MVGMHINLQLSGMDFRDSFGNYQMTSLANRLDVRPVNFENPGCYGFGNSPHSLPFLKVSRGVREFWSIVHDSVNDEDELVKELLRFGRDSTL